LDFGALVKQIVTLTKNLNKAQKIVIASTLIFVVALVSFLIVFNSSNSKRGDDGFRVLFENLTSQDAALIAQELDKRKIEYKLPRTGVIEVPKDIVQKTRLDIAALGIPKDSKVGYELFDKQEFGATDFEQNIKYLRALEGELSRTIESISAINKAKINIAIPKESLFVSKQQPVTASAVIELKSNMVLTPQQIKGIKSLIAASVAKLKPENVKILNQFGDPLGDDDEGTQNSEKLKAELAYKKKFEKALEAKIVDILAPIVGGKTKVVARVTSEFDFSQVSSSAELFSPDNVVRSEQTLEENKKGYSPKQVGGVPGAVSNVGPVQGIKDNTLKEDYSKATTTTNYEISKTIKQTKESFAKIKRITAAVIIDGKYDFKKDKDGKETSEIVYIPLSKEDLASIESLVKRSIGFDTKRGDEVSVSNFQFYVSNQNKEAISGGNAVINMIESYVGPFEPLLKYLFLAIVLFIFYKKIITPFANKMLELKSEDDTELKHEISFEEEEVENTFDKLKEMRSKVEQQLGISGEVNEDELKYDVLIDRIKDIIEEKPEEVASILQSLIKDESHLANDKGD
jgi:flagellar M-ring protein FliF